MAAYVPIDLHRHRSVVMHMADDGEVLGWTRLANDPETLVAEVLKAGEAPEVAIEATYGWYWAVDALQAAGANVHLVAPSKLTAFEGRRVKNDQRDCQAARRPAARRDVARSVDLHTRRCVSGVSSCVTGPSSSGCARGSRPRRMPCWPSTVWPCRCRTCSVSAAANCSPTCATATPASTRPTGNASNHSSRSSTPSTTRSTSCPTSIAELFRDHAGYHAIQQLPGIGPILAAIFVAEIGDVHRFASAAHLASWCGLTPRHRQSDTTVRRGPITKQGSKLVRWAAIEAAQQLRRDSWLLRRRERLAERRNSRAIAKTAIARKLITLIYYGLRDGEIRCLERAA